MPARTLFLALWLAFAGPAFGQPDQVPDPNEPAEQVGTLPRAQHIDLQEPIPAEVLLPAAVAQPTGTADAPETPQESEEEVAAAVEPVPEEVPPFVLLGSEVAPGTSTRLGWAPTHSFEGVYAATPVLIVHGSQPGPVLCLTSAVHGDELNGIETVRRVLYGLDPERLAGTVVGVPIVNLQGFHRSSRYLPDRRDLNRFFPGDAKGSLASRIAYSFFTEVISHCDALVDLHSGSYYRTNLPQLRADLHDPGVLALTGGFASTVVLHSDGAEGTLRRSAVEAGIPAVTLEAGGSMLLDENSVNHSYKAILSLLHHLEMVGKFSLWGQPEPVYYQSTWQRAPVGGVIFSEVKLGEEVDEGDLLGTITNPITNVPTEVRSVHTGRVIGMAMNQFVQPGFAAYHIGILAPRQQVIDDAGEILSGAGLLEDAMEDAEATDHELPDEDAAGALIED